MTEKKGTIGDRVGMAKLAELMKRAQESEGGARFAEGGVIGGVQRAVNDTGVPDPILGAEALERLKDES